MMIYGIAKGRYSASQQNRIHVDHQVLKQGFDFMMIMQSADSDEYATVSQQQVTVDEVAKEQHLKVCEDRPLLLAQCDIEMRRRD